MSVARGHEFAGGWRYTRAIGSDVTRIRIIHDIHRRAIFGAAVRGNLILKARRSIIYYRSGVYGRQCGPLCVANDNAPSVSGTWPI